MERIVTIPTAGIGNAVAAYMIGFDRVEDAVGAGSGRLVTVGKASGVLTAAHVLDNLPDQGAVGIVEYKGETLHYRRQTIDMGAATKIMLRDAASGRMVRISVSCGCRPKASAGSPRSVRSTTC